MDDGYVGLESNNVTGMGTKVVRQMSEFSVKPCRFAVVYLYFCNISACLCILLMIWGKRLTSHINFQIYTQTKGFVASQLIAYMTFQPAKVRPNEAIAYEYSSLS